MNKFERLKQELETSGTGTMKAFGSSMLPILKSGSLLTFEKAPHYEIGDIVFCKVKGRYIDAHKIVKTDTNKGFLIANNHGWENGWTKIIYGRVITGTYQHKVIFERGQKTMKTTEKILIIDLEATCWEGTPPKGQVSEIIEIGICLLDIATGSLTQNKGILVKPEQSSVSTFCTQLTTITQDLLDQSGVSFREACDELSAEYNARQYTWASYGAYDLKMMKAQCSLHAIDFPLSQDHINVKELFAEKKQLKKKTGMNGALHILDIPLEGTHHRGVDDAKNIGKILYWCLQQN